MATPIYFPIARAKAGEIEALGRLSPRAHALVAPMLDFALQRPSDRRSLAQYLAEKLGEIATSWGTADELYLDFSRYEPNTTLPDGRHIASYVFNIARQLRLKAIPVAAPLSMRGPGTEYFEAVASVTSRDQRGLALRIPYGTFSNGNKLRIELTEALAHLGASPSEVDVYLDANSLALVPADERAEMDLARTVGAAASYVRGSGYRRVIFAASELPDWLVPHKKGDVLRVARTEFRVWRRLVAERSLKFLRFGDYGIVHPGQVETEARVIPPSRVRVSLEDEYVFFKGAREEIRSLSQSVVTDGRLHSDVGSWGATAIRECAAGYGDAGGPTQWIARDLNMHIESTVASVARYTDLQEGRDAVSGVDRRGPWLQESFGLVGRK
jgi:hypothetical protein